MCHRNAINETNIEGNINISIFKTFIDIITDDWFGFKSFCTMYEDFETMLTL